MSYQSDPNQPWGSPPPGGPPPGYPSSGYPTPGYPPPGGQPPGYPPPGGQPPGYQPYPNQPNANQPGQPVLAGWWYRVGASVIDGIILGIPSGIVYAAAHSLAAYYVFYGLVGLVYFTLLIGGGGKTVGNMALGTKTLDSTGGTTIGYGRALLRWFVTFILGITLIGGILDVLWPLWDDKNQTIHDKAASSVVVLIR
ncbi:MAG: RDD family protein [Actinomycetota bacterium]|nr:RDD family protein [Actinomycetota bacterium]